ncbi:MAG: adenine deaminase [Clostridiales bacterium]|nr:adenine deaminase [Clostridiales bacterium]
MELIKKNRSVLIQAALGNIACDLSIENASLINVLTGEIYPASVDVKDGVIVRVRMDGEKVEIPSVKTVDAAGKYLAPGFFDTHMHIESSLLVPENFGKAAIEWGTTTVVTDPHEIGNVMGVPGVLYMLESAKKSPVRQFILAPSCIPSVPGIESAGAEFGAAEVAELMKYDEVLGLAEVMDYIGVYTDEKRMHDIIAEADKVGGFIQGHAPELKGKELCAYIVGGPHTDHEMYTSEEILNKRRLGMGINARVQTEKDARMFIDGMTQGMFTDTVALCTDDNFAHKVRDRGSVNIAVSELIKAGMDPILAVKMGTFNGARDQGFTDVGAIAPGYVADMQIVSDLTFVNKAEYVFVAGEMVVENGKYTGEPAGKAWHNAGDTINCIAVKSGDDFRIPAEGHASRKVMVVNEGYREDKLIREELPAEGGFLRIPEERLGELNWISVVNRYGKDTKSLALYRNFGLKRGAMAASIGHDCHNLTLMFADADDAYIAVEELKKCGGGIIYVRDGEVVSLLKLPVAGLMSDLPLEEVAAETSHVVETISKECGIEEFSLGSLIFLPLPVFNWYCPTDFGIVDGPRKKLVQVVE